MGRRNRQGAGNARGFRSPGDFALQSPRFKSPAHQSSVVMPELLQHTTRLSRIESRGFMTNFFLTALAMFPLGLVCAQEQATGPAIPAPASAPASELETLRQQVQSLNEAVKTLQQQVKDQQALIQKANLGGAAALPEQGETPVGSPPPVATAPPLFPTEDTSVVASAAPAPAPGPTGAEVNANGTALPGSFPTTDSSVVSEPSETISTTGAGASLTQPITIGGGRNYMNISFDGMFALAYSSARNLDHIEVGDHDPQQRGFNARNIELAFDGAVDPYFQGFANIVFKLDNDNETSAEVEEAFMQTTDLPFNLQLKGGQFFAAFGRINPTHPHTWDFADAPLVVGRILGPDGLRGVGAQISWTLPTPWYSQLLFGLQNGRGGTGYSFRNPGDNGIFFGRTTTDREMRGLEDFVWIPRWENSVDLSPTQVVLGGVSARFWVQ